MPGRTIDNLEARPQRIKITKLHDDTPFDGTAEKPLVGITVPSTHYEGVWLWFTPSGSYDGTVVFEVSPDGGTRWFPIQGYQPDAIGTPILSIASPALDDSVIVPMPSNSNLRARLNGGSQGSITVEARLIDFPGSMG